MGGTLAGGKQASITNKKKYGPDFYRNIGRMGGKASGTGGFFADRDLASRAGRIGGQISRRGQVKKPIVSIQTVVTPILVVDHEELNITIKQSLWKRLIRRLI